MKSAALLLSYVVAVLAIAQVLGTRLDQLQEARRKRDFYKERANRSP